MIFDPAKSNLREIHHMMTKINNLQHETDDMDQCERDLLVQHMSDTFSMFADTPDKGLIAIELLLIALNADVNAYKEKAKKSRLEFQRFQELRKANLPF